MNNLSTKSQDIKELYSAILLNSTTDEIQSFLDDLLSEDEVKEFANRWKVANMLNDKKLYTEITEITGVSSATIARINKCLTKENSGYLNILSKTEK